jgi:hypothetical protein
LCLGAVVLADDLMLCGIFLLFHLDLDVLLIDLGLAVLLMLDRTDIIRSLY